MPCSFPWTNTLKVDNANSELDDRRFIDHRHAILRRVLVKHSDKIGRKPIIMAGCLIAALTYFPLFKAFNRSC